MLLPLHCQEHGEANGELVVIELEDPDLVNVDLDLERFPLLERRL